mmetsp:Transcript_14978/g.12717  ORF Transcript_14978/g.12717 Transcript_14978/m.12717 type:complete len:101 (-) Transcript_14978:727-1029(-)|eukprot:CAMPEP_0114577512 /NCGR_PEP_ID=MMETSP0125-20121206/2165_1 /TAXON_ID=485358 ORGANISM="Aristerostoma sp., Strain ATCC 50986" /NCGR_SAMPLE_ID=MMETSP0125 /ASSEMBLY_ACC=CAM_ASM_000245 /LENGTH=100 /DNA_ID=CAMNT_0001766883 /DNA_START=1114 /DNA_END=1417 /DNA_ORIENTATION=+
MLEKVVRGEIEGSEKARKKLIDKTKKMVALILENSIDEMVDNNNPLKEMIKVSKKKFMSNIMEKCNFLIDELIESEMSMIWTASKDFIDIKFLSEDEWKA